MRSDVAFVAACVASAAATLVPLGSGAVPSGFPGWPDRFEGEVLVPAPLTEVESRFAAGFPGRIARFRAGNRQLVLRWVVEPTRRLHPAADCYRGSGFQVIPRSPADGWGRFEAVKEGRRVEVLERIRDAAGASWPDVSSWYWSALLGRTGGPWWSEVVARDF